MVANQRLLNIVELTENNMAEPLSVEELASAVGWSRWQLQRTFQARFGYSISTYYRKRRLSNAAIRAHREAMLHSGDRAELRF